MVRNSVSKDAVAKVEFKAGEALFREEQPAEALYVIEAGFVHVTKGIHSQPYQMETLGQGDILGEHALFTGQTYKASAIAVEDTSCLKIPGDQFADMIRRSPDITLRILKKLASRLIHLQFRLSNFALRSPLARLMHQLLAEAERANTERDVPVPFDLPEVLAMERGSVDDLIRRLIRERLITVDDNGNFSIDDLEGYQRCLSYLELKDRFDHIELE